MERKDFLTALGLSAGSIVISSCLGACGKSDTGSPDSSNPSPTPGSKIDFTLDVSSNADINSKGWTIMNGVIIAKSGSSYIALSSACTHQGNPVTYNSGSNNFPCSLTDAAHGSVFDSNGARIQGPATSALKKYSTTLSGSSLRVFEA
ncbi:MAG: Rieske (2Fe-2S) protein [Daejeonella sp.]|uniref:QcrA and Rieske domain-containing protein n=1 Tax=Daejeonella sp. TaxID=2805397 RepID=UPI002734CD51|nr:Rieske (2Fe-2S) protein [Daejeonella sp.]MDP3467168.1 Rieske (2Fe-2S) protein [Daejeonella sp.]